jgi:hypothetical protein
MTSIGSAVTSWWWLHQLSRGQCLTAHLCLHLGMLHVGVCGCGVLVVGLALRQCRIHRACISAAAPRW